MDGLKNFTTGAGCCVAAITVVNLIGYAAVNFLSWFYGDPKFVDALELMTPVVMVLNLVMSGTLAILFLGFVGTGVYSVAKFTQIVGELFVEVVNRHKAEVEADHD